MKEMLIIDKIGNTLTPLYRVLNDLLKNENGFGEKRPFFLCSKQSFNPISHRFLTSAFLKTSSFIGNLSTLFRQIDSANDLFVVDEQLHF